MVMFTTPREWLAGERGISSATLNDQIAANLDYLHDTFTGLRGVYKNVDSLIMTPLTQNLGTFELDTRHQAAIITIVANITGTTPATVTFHYMLNGGTQVELFSFDSGIYSAKSDIAPELTIGKRSFTITAVASTAGLTMSNVQVDIRELS